MNAKHFKVTSDFYNTEFFSFGKYINIHRWISYYHQIDITLNNIKMEGKNVLVIGAGDNIVPQILTLFGCNVTTFDYSKHLSPDIVGDVRTINEHFNCRCYDVIICCQVLEHIKYESFESVLAQFTKISKYVVLSLPNRSIALLGGLIMIPKFKLNFSIRIRRFWERNYNNEEHFWEINAADYRLKKVRKDIKKYFNIKKEFTDSINPYHYFFILETK